MITKRTNVTHDGRFLKAIVVTPRARTYHVRALDNPKFLQSPRADLERVRSNVDDRKSTKLKVSKVKSEVGPSDVCVQLCK